MFKKKKDFTHLNALELISTAITLIIKYFINYDNSVVGMTKKRKPWKK